MPPRAIKHHLTCPFEIISSSVLIGRRRILVIPRNRLVGKIIKLFFNDFLGNNPLAEFVRPGTRAITK